MNYLITGAGGFIASHFLDELLQNNGLSRRIVALDKISYAASFDNLKNIFDRGVSFYHCDLSDKSQIINIIIENKIDFVVNFAAETHVDNSIKDCLPFLKSNVFGVLSILEACKFTGSRLMHISTDEVYGPANKDAFAEDSKLNPQNPYAATKAGAEHLIQSYINTFGIKCLIVRPTNNYGPRQNNEKFIPKYIDCLLKNKKFPLYGDGQQVREWLYVKDCAKILFQLSENYDHLKYNVYNIGDSDSSMKNIDVCKKIHQLAFPNLKTSFEDTISFVEDRLGHDKKYAVDSKRMQFELKNFKFTNFEQGLEDTIKSYVSKSN